MTARQLISPTCALALALALAPAASAAPLAGLEACHGPPPSPTTASQLRHQAAAPGPASPRSSSPPPSSAPRETAPGPRSHQARPPHAPPAQAPPVQASPAHAPPAPKLPDSAQAPRSSQSATPSQTDPPPAPQAIDPAAISAALARLPASPSLADTQHAALRHAGLATPPGRSWQRRARAAAALPTLTVQYDHRLDQGWTLAQEAGTADALRNDGQHQNTLRLRATWELDRLIYAPDELRAARASLDLADWRERILVEVTALYFERQRLLLQVSLAPTPLDLERTIELTVRLREVEGLLEAMTGLGMWGTGPSARLGGGE